MKILEALFLLHGSQMLLVGSCIPTLGHVSSLGAALRLSAWSSRASDKERCRALALHHPWPLPLNSQSMWFVGMSTKPHKRIVLVFWKIDCAVWS